MPVANTAASPVTVLTRLSVDAEGREARVPEGRAGSVTPAVSDDGRFTVFASTAANLVPGDTNSCSDIFLRDLRAGTVSRVSLAPNGGQQRVRTPGDGASSPDISANGRYIVYSSAATNLAPGDTNGLNDIFRYDRLTGATLRVSVATGGAQQAAGDDSTVYGATTPRISADGRHVAFISDAPNLVPGDTNGTADVFVRDLAAGTTIRVSVSSEGVQGKAGDEPWTVAGLALSGNGRTVGFIARYDNLVTDDTNNHSDVFVRDLKTGKTTRVSVASDGREGGFAPYDFPGSVDLSADGRYVVFSTDSPDLVPGDTEVDTDLFLHDRQAGETSCLSVDPEGRPVQGAWIGGEGVSISADGRVVAFASDANGLVAGDDPLDRPSMDVFVRDIGGGVTSRLTAGPAGDRSGSSGTTSGIATGLSANGRVVVFNSDRPNLVTGDANNTHDVFAMPVPRSASYPVDLARVLPAVPLSTSASAAIPLGPPVVKARGLLAAMAE
ncbi:MAG TPA: hypothetical protein VEB64_00945 [Azospirillaceae bacterium]|nr:hypothetical protein [Azospirillaceae bacterium]